jgi:PAS domain S-box-containing protein
MPGISGYELCKALKRDDKFREIPFVLLTARKEPAEIISGLECGADGFLTKPVESKYIAGRLSSLIHNRRMRETGKFRMGVELSFLGRTFNITAEKEQILNLLITTFEDIHLTNAELERKKEELTEAKAKLEDYARHIEVELDVSQEQLKLRNQAIEALDIAVVVMDASRPNRPVEDANPAYERITGYKVQEAYGKSLDLIEGRDTDAAVVAELRAAIDELTPAAGLLQCYRKDGTPFWNDVIVSPVRNSRDVVSHLVVVMRDMSERKTLERQFAQAQKMEAVGQLTGGVAHDFNNLLTIILGNLDLLQGEAPLDSRGREMLDQAIRASLRGAELTRQLLAFSRRQSLESKVISLKELIRGTIDLLRRTLGEQIEVETSLPDDLWPALADPAQVESALANLAINARDAMALGGRLTIEAANQHLDMHYAAQNSEVEPGDYVMLAVSDTGSGIPPEIIERVVEPFFTTKEDGKGTGLGLSMVYGFAKQSGGHFKIYSEVGHGTTVRLYLPRARGDAAADTPPLGGILKEPGSATILVVEDNADVRQVAATTLASFGHQVLEAPDAKAALEILKQDRRIDLLFTDVVMPGGMSGLELAERARELRSGIKILLTSGFAKAAMGNAAQSYAAGQLLSKPYRTQDLARAIRETLQEGGE